ncbi:MAG TPA: hypothetical protein VLD64_04375 [Nitrosarchaeum sp.]|nr:hypothetical protein [Nitrosarchaeum sp.]
MSTGTMEACQSILNLFKYSKGQLNTMPNRKAILYHLNIEDPDYEPKYDFD